MKRLIPALILAAGAGWVAASDMGQGRQFGAQGGSPADAWKAERAKYSDVPGFERPKAFQDKVLAHNERYHALISSEGNLRYHPIPAKQYKGVTVAAAVNASYREINSFKAGIEAFAAEVKAMAAGSRDPKADAPNLFLVGQGWKIVKALAGVFNEQVVPGANMLYAASTKGNQNLEILIDIAGGKLSAIPNAAKLAGTQSQLQLLNEVQREHDGAGAQRAKAGPMLSAGRAEVPKIYGLVEEYDRAYSEYARGMRRLKSDGARLAESTLFGVNQAVTTAQAAAAALERAEAAEQKAIDAVRACTEGTIAALQSPDDAAAQATAANLNSRAIAEVEKANQARGAANDILESPTMPGSVAAGDGAEMEDERRVYYRRSGALGAQAGRSAAAGAKRLGPDRGPEAADARP